MNYNTIVSNFLKKGYVKFKPKKTDLIDIQNIVLKSITKKNLLKNDRLRYLNNYHLNFDYQQINIRRLEIYNNINSIDSFSKKYYSIVEDVLNMLVGNELAMQIKINLSIQLPNDKSSILPLHSDTWSGDSPFEVVVWIPLVDCYKSKSMFILNPRDSKIFYHNYKADSEELDSKSLFDKYKKKFEWINIKFGEVLIFNQCLPHGNIENKTNETRWSLNCRFKSLFSPYGEKKIGEFFKPINIKPASLIGFNYQDPLSK